MTPVKGLFDSPKGVAIHRLRTAAVGGTCCHMVERQMGFFSPPSVSVPIHLWSHTLPNYLIKALLLLYCRLGFNLGI